MYNKHWHQRKKDSLLKQMHLFGVLELQIGELQISAVNKAGFSSGVKDFFFFLFFFKEKWSKIGFKSCLPRATTGGYYFFFYNLFANKDISLTIKKTIFLHSSQKYLSQQQFLEGSSSASNILICQFIRVSTVPYFNRQSPDIQNGVTTDKYFHSTIGVEVWERKTLTGKKDEEKMLCNILIKVQLKLAVLKNKTKQKKIWRLLCWSNV